MFDLSMWVDAISATRPDLIELLKVIRILGTECQNHVSTIDFDHDLRVFTSIECYELLWTLFVGYSTTSSECTPVMNITGLRELCIDCAIVTSPKNNYSTGKRELTSSDRFHNI